MATLDGDEPANQLADPASSPMRMNDVVSSPAGGDVDVDMADADARPVLSDAQIKTEENAGEGETGGDEDIDLDKLLEDEDDELVNGLDEQVSADPADQRQSRTTKQNYSDPEVMRAFYQRLFPFRHLFQWLNHAIVPTTDFSNREFAFTLPNDAYLRYQSFRSADLLRRQCVEMLPSRFEIGPEYSTNPRDRKTLRSSTAFKPVAKELVFDIDMTDYDPIRTCCSGAAICHDCWTFMTMAIKVIDTALRADFGFCHILWVYSGRRGVHAWVCDRKARMLDDNERRAIAGYFELLQDSSTSEKKVNLRRPLHPHIERSLNLLKSHFSSDILQRQNPWATADRAKRLSTLLSQFPSLSTALARKWDSAPGRSSTQKWADIDVEARSGAHPSLNAHALLDTKQDIVLEYTYPRLDAEVSKRRNHLLKSPFVVHPGTGRVCVPIDMADVDTFDPLTVPTVTTLLDQIDNWDQKEKEKEKVDESDVDLSAATHTQKKIQDWEKTELKPYIDYFRAFVARLIKDENVKVKEELSERNPLDF